MNNVVSFRQKVPRVVEQVRVYHDDEGWHVVVEPAVSRARCNTHVVLWDEDLAARCAEALAKEHDCPIVWSTGGAA